jgi:hypothetical protein
MKVDYSDRSLGQCHAAARVVQSEAHPVRGSWCEWGAEAVRRIAIWLCCVCAALSLSSGSALAQLATDPRLWADAFFDTLLQQGEEAAAKVLREETYLGRASPEDTAYAAQKIAKVRELSGTPISYEFFREASVGARTKRLQYIVNYVYKAALYNLIFYRTDRGWQLMFFSFEDRPERFPFD